jgi:hypothetical protein
MVCIQKGTQLDHKKTKLGHPYIHERGPYQQNHNAMNACILNHAHSIQWQNDQNATIRT